MSVTVDQQKIHDDAYALERHAAQIYKDMLELRDWFATARTKGFFSRIEVTRVLALIGENDHKNTEHRAHGSIRFQLNLLILSGVQSKEANSDIVHALDEAGKENGESGGDELSQRLKEWLTDANASFEAAEKHVAKMDAALNNMYTALRQSRDNTPENVTEIRTQEFIFACEAFSHVLEEFDDRAKTITTHGTSFANFARSQVDNSMVRRVVAGLLSHKWSILGTIAVASSVVNMAATSWNAQDAAMTTFVTSLALLAGLELEEQTGLTKKLWQYMRHMLQIERKALVLLE